MTDFAEYRRRRVARTTEVRLPADPTLPERIADARARVAAAERYDRMHNEPDTAPAARAELAELEARAEDDVLVFRFRELGRAAYYRLIADHPPDDPDVHRWNLDSFAPAILAACAVEPELTDDDAVELYTTWGAWAVDQLVTAAIEVNEVGGRVPTSPRG